MMEAYYISQSQITESYNTEKIVKDSKIDDIIQYSNNILVL